MNLLSFRLPVSAHLLLLINTTGEDEEEEEEEEDEEEAEEKKKDRGLVENSPALPLFLLQQAPPVPLSVSASPCLSQTPTACCTSVSPCSS